MNNKIVGLFVVIALVIVGFFALNAFLKDDMVEPGSSVIEDDTVVDEYIVTENTLVVPDQAAGSEVFVERVEFLDGGYIVIHRAVMEESDATEEEGNESTYTAGDIVGTSEYLEAGVKQNFIVALNEDEITEVDDKYYAMLHIEQGLESMMDTTMEEKTTDEDMAMEEETAEITEDEMEGEMMSDEEATVPADGDATVTDMPDETTIEMEEEAHSFNPAEDVPMVDEDGNIVMVLFTILADDVPGFETKL